MMNIANNWKQVLTRIRKCGIIEIVQREVREMTKLREQLTSKQIEDAENLVKNQKFGACVRTEQSASLQYLTPFVDYESKNLLVTRKTVDELDNVLISRKR